MDTGPNDEDQSECELLGIPLDDIGPGFDQDLGVWAANVDAVEAFLDVTTQFIRLAMPDGTFRVTGLNYPGAQAAWQMAGLKITPDLFAQVQMIERGALAEWNGN
ncbi:DUF1799 domain-containing protein [Parasedimentitalea psychrophila]|uniref:DUF1799 domain-containing protein n=1 Tax=Parasedimentitalea psychrophila TaxID=2997337 RepID=A0A9Y2P6U0_9RHOB|nr:DUF1799 domain-containing protein [Parasedimentitalea psychrophila]WIY25065.1 DUF1799 domain-containing protein [Parasedimentitalea psychrophila]